MKCLGGYFFLTYCLAMVFKWLFAGPLLVTDCLQLRCKVGAEIKVGGFDPELHADSQRLSLPAGDAECCCSPSVCVTLLPLSCSVFTRSPQWSWCPRWPWCCCCVAQPQAGASTAPGHSCIVGLGQPPLWGPLVFGSPEAPEVSPAQPLQWARPCSVLSSRAGFGTDPLSSCG